MDPYIYIILVVLVIDILAVIIFIIKNNKNKKQQNAFDISLILALLDKNNINKVEYIRNKIVISFKDVTIFNIEDLHKNGATGISVVGDKVKFYVDGDNIINEILFNSIRDYIEGK